MDRRSFIKKAGITAGGAAAASTLAAPAIAQGKKELVIVSTWPRDFPGLGISAQRLAARITELSEGRITTKYFAAGERVGAFDSFDRSGFRQCAGLSSLPTTTGKASILAGPISRRYLSGLTHNRTQCLALPVWAVDRPCGMNSQDGFGLKCIACRIRPVSRWVAGSTRKSKTT